MTNLEIAIAEAKEFASTEGGNWCVIHRCDPEGGLFEYAVMPAGTAIDDASEHVVFQTDEGVNV